jgi:polyisoprenoid-binding protein YceI
MLRTGMFGVYALAAALSSPLQPAAGDVVWSADRTRSGVTLSVSRLLAPKVTGEIPIATGRIVTADGALAPHLVDVILDSTALTTHDMRRDADLRSGRFFDVTRYPTIAFASARVRETGPLTFTVDGALTIRGISRPIRFDAHIGDLRFEGAKRYVRYEAVGRFRRSDYGMNDARGIVGDVVALDVVIEAVNETGVTPARR